MWCTAVDPYEHALSLANAGAAGEGRGAVAYRQVLGMPLAFLVLGQLGRAGELWRTATGTRHAISPAGAGAPTRGGGAVAATGQWQV
eukprot:1161692-Pelagomonas_calceolata.AAC.2